MRLRQAFAKERDAIRSRGGMVRMSDALRLGISRKALYANRGTALKSEPVALTTEFSESEAANTQWRAFVRKGRLANAPASLGEAVSGIACFLLPVARAHLAGGAFRVNWTAGGPWQE